MDATSDSCRLTCRNELTALPAINAQIQQFVHDKNVSQKATYALELAIEELVTNIIKYGHEDDGEHLIDIRIELEPRRVVLTIEDDGHAFNPLEREAPDTSKPPEERPIGGLGLHMVREMSEEMTYRREGSRNIIVVRIPRTQ